MKKDAPICDCEIIHGDIVALVNSHMLPPDEINDLSALFKILGDPTRIRIMWALSQAEMCVCDLGAALRMSKSAISHQLNTLRQGKLVKYRREGKNIFYSLDDEHVNQIIDIGRAHVEHE